MATSPAAAPADLNEALSSSVRPLMDLVDDLRKIGVQKDVPIPQIAVMGDQSSGKSSVLEALSGIPFPRGTGLVTRCATQLSMSRGQEWSATIEASDNTDSRAVFTVHSKAGIADRIKELTDTLCGGGGGGEDSKGICHDRYIQVKVEAPDMPDLTIIDLPGIVRTATQGQSKTVIQDVDALLSRYLKQDRTVVLAVIPVNVDIATVDILERAAKVDPDGARTMGVLTKPDLVDKGGESGVLGILANRVKPLKHGYVMLRNRSVGLLNSPYRNYACCLLVVLHLPTPHYQYALSTHAGKCLVLKTYSLTRFPHLLRSLAHPPPSPFAARGARRRDDIGRSPPERAGMVRREQIRWRRESSGRRRVDRGANRAALLANPRRPAGHHAGDHHQTRER